MRKNNLLRNLWYSLSSRQRYIVRRIYYFPIDLYDKLTGKRKKGVPPRGYIYTGSASSSAENFLQQGIHQLELLKNNIELKPDDFVLDIGSGIERTAIALTKYLNNVGRYDGFDVVEKGVIWCNSKIKCDFSNFNFKYTPIYNDLYNDSGSKATDFIFPYHDNYFDKIFSFSVFTHMQIDEIEHYLTEIKRVLKPDGICLSSFFLYDHDIENYISNRETFNFPIDRNGFKLMNETTKSGNIAIGKTRLKKMLIQNDIKLVKIIDGFWKDEINDNKKIEYQDLVIFKIN